METVIAKGATDSDVARTPAFFYESARAGMRDLLMRGPEPASGRGGVLLPAYIGWSAREGSGVFDPVHESGRRYGFYRLTGDLSADLADVERQLASGEYQYLVVIHYFGRLERRMADLRKIADAAGVILVDDLAHGFFSAMRSVEEWSPSHVAMYSLHKQFAVPCGGMVIYRRSDLIAGQKSTHSDLAGEVLSYDWHEIGRRRRTNFEEISAALAPEAPGLGVRLMWPELHPLDVPQTMPVLLDTADRDRVYAEMNEHGFGMVSLYHTLIPELRGFDERSDRIAKTIINFPVHQDVDTARIGAMVERFVTAVRRNSGGDA
ncbi:DegT/DnrJ/EryC1/StrS family aminotransferase [Microbacterium petrolearium]